jgi:PadR family transcriptional regulator, regulatory protein AphA
LSESTATDLRLSTTEATVLGLLAFGRRSGYDLLGLAQRSVGYLWTPSRSQVYKVLPRLVDAGLATSREVAQSRRPDKAVYTITAQGRKALRSWLGEIERDPPDAGAIFVLKLFFSDLVAPEVALAQLNAYRAFLERRLARFERMRTDRVEEARLFPQLVLDRAIARIRTTLDWTDEAEAAIARQKRLS